LIKLSYILDPSGNERCLTKFKIVYESNLIRDKTHFLLSNICMSGREESKDSD